MGYGANVNGKYVYFEEDEPVPSAEEYSAALAETIRGDRERLLKDCDWTQQPDVPEATRKKWQVYRQALRDITKHEKFPDTFDVESDFPDKPS